jgi:hypothetical protein
MKVQWQVTCNEGKRDAEGCLLQTPLPRIYIISTRIRMSFVLQLQPLERGRDSRYCEKGPLFFSKGAAGYQKGPVATAWNAFSSGCLNPVCSHPKLDRLTPGMFPKPEHRMEAQRDTNGCSNHEADPAIGCSRVRRPNGCPQAAEPIRHAGDYALWPGSGLIASAINYTEPLPPIRGSDYRVNRLRGERGVD